MATRNNLEAFRTQDTELDFTMDPVENIAGWTIVFVMKKTADEGRELSHVSGVVVSGPAGTFTVTIPAADLDVDPGDYVYQVWRTDVGSRAPLAFGTITVLPKVPNA